MFNPPDATTAEGRQEEPKMDAAIQERLAKLRAQARGEDATPPPTPPEKVEETLAASVAEQREEQETEAGETVDKALDSQIKALKLGARAERALLELGVFTVEDLLDFDAERATEVQGVGAGAVDKIKEAQETLRAKVDLKEKPKPDEAEPDAPNETKAPAAAEEVSKLGESPVPEFVAHVKTVWDEDITLAQLASIARRHGAKITIEIGES